MLLTGWFCAHLKRKNRYASSGVELRQVAIQIARKEFNKKVYENTAKFERTYSDESISSMNSCSSKISVQSDGSDFININDLFPKPFAVKGNMI